MAVVKPASGAPAHAELGQRIEDDVVVGEDVEGSAA